MEHPPIAVGFLLVSGFAELHLNITTEALRVANRVTGRSVFDTVVVTPDGAPAVANSGRIIRPDARLGGDFSPAALVTIAGLEPQSGYRPAVGTALRALDRRGCLLVCVDTGAELLAAAGLAGPGPVAIHWEYAPVFSAGHPDVATVHRGYVWSGGRLSCSGGLSVGPMAFELIARLADAALAGRVEEVLNYERTSEAESAGVRPDPVSRVEAIMRTNLARPLRLVELAQAVGADGRTLNRWFRRERGTSPMRAYRQLRLEHGRDLLRYGRLTVAQAADASGFASSAHFCTAFRAAFGRSPGAARLARGSTSPPD